MCERLGFTDVVVDESDISMTMELPADVLEAGNNQNRNRVHVGSAEFSHLEGVNMDEMCARVCVIARKPSADDTPRA